MTERPTLSRRIPDEAHLLAKAAALADSETALAAEIGHVLDLRLRARRDPEIRALLDRALSILVRLDKADVAAFAGLAAEIDDLGARLALRFGAPRGEAVQ
ncbi:MAG: hypothetical protein DI570_12585 [Phenylobacterium zucineum]|nr:MAG: hypothetical protein DI570_12585 [Phenylobacterium zucineum]